MEMEIRQVAVMYDAVASAIDRIGAQNIIQILPNLISTRIEKNGVPVKNLLNYYRIESYILVFYARNVPDPILPHYVDLYDPKEP